MNYTKLILIFICVHRIAMGGQLPLIPTIQPPRLANKPTAAVPAQPNTPALSTTSDQPQITAKPRVINRGPAVPVRLIDQFFDALADTKGITDQDKQKIQLLKKALDIKVGIKGQDQFPDVDEVVSAIKWISSTKNPAIRSQLVDSLYFGRALIVIENNYNNRVTQLTNQMAKADPTVVSALNQQLVESTTQATIIHLAVANAQDALKKKQ